MPISMIAGNIFKINVAWGVYEVVRNTLIDAVTRYTSWILVPFSLKSQNSEFQETGEIWVDHLFNYNLINRVRKKWVLRLIRIPSWLPWPVLFGYWEDLCSSITLTPDWLQLGGPFTQAEENLGKITLFYRRSAVGKVMISPEGYSGESCLSANTL